MLPATSLRHSLTVASSVVRSASARAKRFTPTRQASTTSARRAQDDETVEQMSDPSGGPSDVSSAPSSSPSPGQLATPLHISDDPQHGAPSTGSSPTLERHESRSSSSSSPSPPAVNAVAGPSSVPQRRKRKPTSSLAFHDDHLPIRESPRLSSSRPGSLDSVVGSGKGKERAHDERIEPAGTLSVFQTVNKATTTTAELDSQSAGSYPLLRQVRRPPSLPSIPKGSSSRLDQEYTLEDSAFRGTDGTPAESRDPDEVGGGTAVDAWEHILTGLSAPDRATDQGSALGSEGADEAAMAAWENILLAARPPPRPKPPVRQGPHEFSPPPAHLAAPFAGSQDPRSVVVSVLVEPPPKVVPPPPSPTPSPSTAASIPSPRRAPETEAVRPLRVPTFLVAAPSPVVVSDARTDPSPSRIPATAPPPPSSVTTSVATDRHPTPPAQTQMWSSPPTESFPSLSPVPPPSAEPSPSDELSIEVEVELAEEEDDLLFVVVDDEPPLPSVEPRRRALSVSHAPPPPSSRSSMVFAPLPGAALLAPPVEPRPVAIQASEPERNPIVSVAPIPAAITPGPLPTSTALYPPAPEPATTSPSSPRQPLPHFLVQRRPLLSATSSQGLTRVPAPRAHPASPGFASSPKPSPATPPPTPPKPSPLASPSYPVRTPAVSNRLSVTSSVAPTLSAPSPESALEDPPRPVAVGLPRWLQPNHKRSPQVSPKLSPQTSPELSSNSSPTPPSVPSPILNSAPAPPRTVDGPFSSAPSSLVQRAPLAPAPFQLPAIPASTSLLANDVQGAELVDFLIPSPSDLHSAPKYTRTLELSVAASARHRRPTVFGNVEDPDWSPSARGLAYFKFFQPKGPRFFEVGSAERFPETAERKAEEANQQVVAAQTDVGRMHHQSVGQWTDHQSRVDRRESAPNHKHEAPDYGLKPEYGLSESESAPPALAAYGLKPEYGLSKSASAPPPLAAAPPDLPTVAPPTPAPAPSRPRITAAEFIRNWTDPSTETPSRQLSSTEAYLLAAQPSEGRPSSDFDGQLKVVVEEDAAGGLQAATLQRLVSLAKDVWDLRVVMSVIALGEDRGRRSQNREIVASFIDKCLELDAALLVVILASSPDLYGISPSVLFATSPHLRYILLESILADSPTFNSSTLPALPTLTRLDWSLPILQRSLPPHPVVSALTIKAYASLPPSPPILELLKTAEQDARAGWRKNWEVKPSSDPKLRAKEWDLVVGSLLVRGNKDILPYWRAWLPKTGDVAVQRETIRKEIVRLTNTATESAAAPPPQLPSVSFLDRLLAIALKEFPQDPILHLSHLHLLALLPASALDRSNAIERVLIASETYQPSWDAEDAALDLTTVEAQVKRSELSARVRESLDKVEEVFGVRPDLWQALEEDTSTGVEIWIRSRSSTASGSRGRVGGWDWGGGKTIGRVGGTKGLTGKVDGLSMRFGRMQVSSRQRGGATGGEIKKQTRGVASVGIYG